MAFVYLKFYKPFGVLSQFTKEVKSHKTLADFLDVPKDVYPIGRLDKDSEGLLLLTNDKALVDKILNPAHKLNKTYFVQLEGIPEEMDFQMLSKGVRIKIKTGKYYQTEPCNVEIIEEPKLPKRVTPIRTRKNKPTSWAKITIWEGKNRQVRKMFAHIGYPVLRLIRYSIGKVNISQIEVGKLVKINDRKEII